MVGEWGMGDGGWGMGNGEWGLIKSRMVGTQNKDTVEISEYVEYRRVL